MKVCSHCKQEKPLKEFGLRNRKLKNGDITKGYNCYCKLCNSQRAKDRYYNMKTKGLRFVYRLVNSEGEVVYIGKTESLPTRTNQHFSKNGHLFPKLKTEENLKVQYIAMTSSVLMDIREIYYINLYKPKYNKSWLYNEPNIFISDFTSDVWIDYSPKDTIQIQNKLDVFNEFSKIRSIFKRKRGNRWLVYIDAVDMYGKKKQVRKGSFLEEEEANELILKLKEYRNNNNFRK